MSPLPENLFLQVVSEIHDPVTTTDELIPSGETSSYRSNPLGLAEFTLSRKDPEYVGRAKNIQKAQKAFNCGGPSFINAISPCPRGWRFASSDTISISKLAVETCVWPLFEVENGEYHLSPESQRIADGKAEKKPVTDWFASQGRFKHLMDERWSDVVEDIQIELDRRWNKLIKLSDMSSGSE